jgi:hypothetical protein
MSGRWVVTVCPAPPRSAGLGESEMGLLEGELR